MPIITQCAPIRRCTITRRGREKSSRRARPGGCPTDGRWSAPSLLPSSGFMLLLARSCATSAHSLQHTPKAAQLTATLTSRRCPTFALVRTSQSTAAVPQLDIDHADEVFETDSLRVSVNTLNCSQSPIIFVTDLYCNARESDENCEIGPYCVYIQPHQSFCIEAACGGTIGTVDFHVNLIRYIGQHFLG